MKGQQNSVNFEILLLQEKLLSTKLSHFVWGKCNINVFIIAQSVKQQMYKNTTNSQILKLKLIKK